MIDGWSTPACEWKMTSNCLVFKVESNIVDNYYNLLENNKNIVLVITF